MGKNQNKTFALLVFGGVACLCSTGCDQSPSVHVKSLGGGYEEVVYTRTHFSEPESHQITLQFRNAEGKQTMIWPSLMSATVVKDDVAVFVADRTWGLTKKDGIWPTTSRFFAVKVPNQPLDITDEVVGRWAQESGKDVAKYLEEPGPIEPQEKDGKINIEFEFTNFPKIVVSLRWDQLSNVMDAVKSKGVQHIDPKWGITYLGKEFKPEIQK